MKGNFFAFDFDGVLANSLALALEEYGRIIAAEFPAIPVPSGREDLAFIFPGPLHTSLRRFGLRDPEIKRFFDLHSHAMRCRSAEINLFLPVVEFLAATGFNKFAIVTSAYSDAVRQIFQRSGYAELSVKAPIYGRELAIRKSEKFRRIAADHNFSLDRIVKIGDLVSDILYAREAGVDIWTVGWGYHPSSYLAAFCPNEHCETFSELCDKVSQS